MGQTEFVDFEGTTPVFVAVQFSNAQHIALLAREGESSNTVRGNYCELQFQEYQNEIPIQT